MKKKEDQYRRLAQSIYKRFVASGGVWGEPSNFVAFLDQEAKRLRPATTKLWKWALVWDLGDRGQNEVRDHIRAWAPKKAVDLPLRTSARKLKRLPAEVVTALRERPASVTRDAVVDWLLAAELTGLRPSEWPAARVRHIGEGLELFTDNAKASHGRAHGADRTLTLVGASDEHVGALHRHLSRVQECVGESGFMRFYQRCQKWLDRNNRHRTSRGLKVMLYSSRHQFAADGKASGIGKANLAAVMGHGSDETAGRHYGKSRSGRKGAFKATASPEEVARVRHNAPDFKLTRPAPGGG